MNNELAIDNIRDFSNKVVDITDSKQLANDFGEKADMPKKVSGEDAATNSDKKFDGFSKGEPHQCECEACKNRRYRDGSTDGGVSFKAPIKMHPSLVKGAVKGHELEHVRRCQYEAKKENKTIVSQSVQIKSGTCKECGNIYVKGGETRTTVRAVGADFYKVFCIGLEDELEKVDKKL